MIEPYSATFAVFWIALLMKVLRTGPSEGIQNAS